jgi:acetyl-CoA acetyltransferase
MNARPGALGALRQYGLKRGVASLCIGGGEATALALECPLSLDAKR